MRCQTCTRAKLRKNEGWNADRDFSEKRHAKRHRKVVRPCLCSTLPTPRLVKVTVWQPRWDTDVAECFTATRLSPILLQSCFHGHQCPTSAASRKWRAKCGVDIFLTAVARVVYPSQLLDLCRGDCLVRPLVFRLELRYVRMRRILATLYRAWVAQRTWMWMFVIRMQSVVSPALVSLGRSIARARHGSKRQREC